MYSKDIGFIDNEKATWHHLTATFLQFGLGLRTSTWEPDADGWRMMETVSDSGKVRTAICLMRATDDERFIIPNKTIAKAKEDGINLVIVVAPIAGLIYVISVAGITSETAKKYIHRDPETKEFYLLDEMQSRHSAPERRGSRILKFRDRSKVDHVIMVSQYLAISQEREYESV